MSQTYLKNGSEGVRFGSMHNQRGIFGACPPDKILHLISLSWFKYCLQVFSAQAGPKSQALKDYDVLRAKWGYTLSRQSDCDVPQTNFSQPRPTWSCICVRIFWTMGSRECEEFLRYVSSHSTCQYTHKKHAIKSCHITCSGRC